MFDPGLGLEISVSFLEIKAWNMHYAACFIKDQPSL